jgi:uncharacterized membrane protein YphA (DoxX/SURF4 family)
MKRGIAEKHQAAILLLRVGLGIIFLYAAVSSLANPRDWLGYLPQVARDMFDGFVLLKIFAVYELLLVLWLAIGKYVHYAALLAAATLAGIVLANFSLFAITFRDIALIFAALALAVLAWPQAAKR